MSTQMNPTLLLGGSFSSNLLWIHGYTLSSVGYPWLKESFVLRNSMGLWMHRGQPHIFQRENVMQNVTFFSHITCLALTWCLSFCLISANILQTFCTNKARNAQQKLLSCFVAQNVRHQVRARHVICEKNVTFCITFSLWKMWGCPLCKGQSWKRQARLVAGGKGLAYARQAFNYHCYFCKACCSLHWPIIINISCHIFYSSLPNYLKKLIHIYSKQKNCLIKGQISLVR